MPLSSPSCGLRFASRFLLHAIVVITLVLLFLSASPAQTQPGADATSPSAAPQTETVITEFPVEGVQEKIRLAIESRI